jgi:hypothetical protein
VSRSAGGPDQPDEGPGRDGAGHLAQNGRRADVDHLQGREDWVPPLPVRPAAAPVLDKARPRDEMTRGAVHEASACFLAAIVGQDGFGAEAELAVAVASDGGVVAGLSRWLAPLESQRLGAV